MTYGKEKHRKNPNDLKLSARNEPAWRSILVPSLVEKGPLLCVGSGKVTGVYIIRIRLT